MLPAGYACSYDNQVNIWTSADHGATWQPTCVASNVPIPGCTGHVTSPFGLGFSDPDLTIDEGGWLYNTGIDLANDAVFASQDGGRTFPAGNNNCHSGDRPWLAGGDVPTDTPTGSLSAPSGEVFLATDTTIDASDLGSGHEIFRGVISGTGAVQTLQCYNAAGALVTNDPSGLLGPGIRDFGASQTGGTYSASGKLFYNHNNVNTVNNVPDGYHGALIDPAFFNNANGDQGVGISILPNADAAFGPTSTVTNFPQQYEVGGYSRPGSDALLGHWPSIAIDSNDVVYETWDTPDQNGSGNYNNSIMLSTFDLKNPSAGFTAPIAITHSSSTPTAGSPTGTVLWPWIAVPSGPSGAGNASVVWYQYDSLVNPDPATTGNVFLMESSLFGLNSGTVTKFGPQDAAAGSIHVGGICQSGTTCVATGQDRRLGDFFTNAIDENGCVMIASGETRTQPTAATSRPLYIQQSSGTSLTGQSCVTPTAGPVPEGRWPAVFVVAGLGVAAVALRRRRPRRRVAA